MFEIITSDLKNLVLNFLRMLFILLVIAHWSACLFYFIGTIRAKGESATWITRYGFQDSTPIEMYVNAMYFSITTMTTIGYGDIVPVSSSEYIVVMFLELLAGITFAYVIGKIGDLFKRYNLLAETYK